jgi:hypothetical protein
MSNMYSIGELIDKLIIENIKLFDIRDSINKNPSDPDFVENENKMNILNENRSIIVKFLNEKIDNVFNNIQQNVYFKDIKTYNKVKKKLKNRPLNDNISKLTKIWRMWVYHRKKSIDVTKPDDERYTAAKRCEKLQTFRQMLITQINDNMK